MITKKTSYSRRHVREMNIIVKAISKYDFLKGAKISEIISETKKKGLSKEATIDYLKVLKKNGDIRWLTKDTPRDTPKPKNLTKSKVYEAMKKFPYESISAKELSMRMGYRIEDNWLTIEMYLKDLTAEGKLDKVEMFYVHPKTLTKVNP